MFDAEADMNQSAKRVLLVNDDDGFLEMVQVALRTHGYDVLVARDGSEALVRAERDNPDLVVLDIVIPKRSGFSVLAHLRNGNIRRQRIVIVSGNHEPHYQKFAMSQGADAVLLKPFEVDQLLNEVDLLLQS